MDQNRWASSRGTAAGIGCATAHPYTHDCMIMTATINPRLQTRLEYDCNHDCSCLEAALPSPMNVRQ
eukprot:scaffold123602_cov17-Tisochrysis_lutea.AAC.2